MGGQPPQGNYELARGVGTLALLIVIAGFACVYLAEYDRLLGVTSPRLGYWLLGVGTVGLMVSLALAP